MKRLVLCSAILAAIVFGGIFSLHVFSKKNTELISIISSAEDFARQNKIDQAKEELDRLDRFWSDYYVLTSYILQNSKLEEISASVSKLHGLLEKDEFFAECDSIIYSVKMLYDKEYPHIHSVI